MVRLLQQLFNDQLYFWKSSDGQSSGWRECVDPAEAEPLVNDNRTYRTYIWSGPLGEWRASAAIVARGRIRDAREYEICRSLIDPAAPEAIDDTQRDVLVRLIADYERDGAVYQESPECAGQVVRKVDTVPMRLLLLPVLAAALLPGVLHGQRPVAQPGPLSGAWETTTAGGTHGIFVRITTHASGSIDRQTITFRALTCVCITARMVMRPGDEWGQRASSVVHLRWCTIARRRPRCRLSRRRTERWTGSWLLDGETRDVVLERPRPDPDSTPHRLCGDWEGYRTRPGWHPAGFTSFSRRMERSPRGWIARCLLKISDTANC